MRKLKNGARQSNYDLMRVFAMMMVIINHIADYYYSMFLDNNISPSKSIYYFEGISHFAVPLFLMMTGLFMIDKAGNQKRRQFYTRALKKLGIPFFVFVIVYYIYDLKNGNISKKGVLYSLVKGFQGYYAHWYVVMLAVIYSFLPLIAFIKKRVEYCEYRRVSVIIFIWLITGHYFESSYVVWSLSILYFMGYVLMGDIIGSALKDKSNNLLGTVLIIVAIALMLLNHSLLYRHVNNGGDYYNKLLNLYSAPLIVVSALIAFSGFSLLNVKKDFSVLADVSYTVFLSHKLILSIISEHTSFMEKLETVFDMKFNILIPVELVILTFVSCVVAYLFNAVLYLILNKIIKKDFVKNE